MEFIFELEHLGGHVFRELLLLDAKKVDILQHLHRKIRNGILLAIFKYLLPIEQKFILLNMFSVTQKVHYDVKDGDDVILKGWCPFLFQEGDRLKNGAGIVLRINSIAQFGHILKVHERNIVV